MILSLLLVLFGFTQWYFKHQIYIDAEIEWKGESFRKLIKEEHVFNTDSPKQTEVDTTNIEQSEK